MRTWIGRDDRPVRPLGRVALAWRLCCSSVSPTSSLGEHPHPWVRAGAAQVRFGVSGGPRDDWPALHDFVQMVEGLGFDSYWRPDQPLANADCWTTLAALAGRARRLWLGTSVVCVSYRHPALVARMAADVDRISGG